MLKDEDIHMHGGRGQEQYGVDVYARPEKGD
jgi:hypothetical protein